MKKLLFVFIIIAITFKPLLEFSLEKYLSSLLETEVVVKELNIFDLSVDTSIKQDENRALIKITSFSPLKADINYQGDIDAFSLYHPLHGKSNIDGNVSYDESPA